jgi:hypothetical protein
MCTVTYIPIESNAFYLTHNRDEDVKRAIATPPVKRIIHGRTHMFPVDPQGRGTWIGMSEQGRIASLMNGGSKDHDRNPPYRHSRGLIIPDYFKHPNVEVFLDSYDFLGLEPFTLFIFENGNIYEITKNEDGLDRLELDPSKPFIRSSRPLYTDKSMNERKISFIEWMFHPGEITKRRIMDFHRSLTFETTADQSKVPADHVLRTVSITSIHQDANQVFMHYLDKVNEISFKNGLRITEGVHPGMV